MQEAQPNELIPHLFRTEYSKIVAVLCNTFNLHYLEIAEEIASETFLKATEVWALRGVPENPAAWLYTVAKNKVRDYFKHQTFVERQNKTFLKTSAISFLEEFEFSNQRINDSQLAMIFAVCDPVNSKEGQISLALQILCGFTVEQIAHAFLAKTDTIKKRLLRARYNLRKGELNLNELSEDEICIRIDSVLKTLYLLFNEGYFSKTTNEVIRKDLCSEALRLCSILIENPLTNTAQSNALMSLLCFQSSRLDARIGENGDLILFDEQDRNRWNLALINSGNEYLVAACSGSTVSRFHLEAAIAYWHTTNDINKWQHIGHLYDELIQIEYSPVTAMNRIYVISKLKGKEVALEEMARQEFPESCACHSLLGYLYSGIDIEKSVSHYKQAIQFTRSTGEIHILEREIEKLMRVLV